MVDKKIEKNLSDLFFDFNHTRSKFYIETSVLSLTQELSMKTFLSMTFT